MQGYWHWEQGCTAEGSVDAVGFLRAPMSHTHRQTGTYTQADRHIYIQADRHTYTEADRHTYTQADRDRHETDRHTLIHRHRH